MITFHMISSYFTFIPVSYRPNHVAVFTKVNVSGKAEAKMKEMRCRNGEDRSNSCSWKFYPSISDYYISIYSTYIYIICILCICIFFIYHLDSPFFVDSSSGGEKAIRPKFSEDGGRSEIKNCFFFFSYGWKTPPSMDYLKGKSTGNHRMTHEICFFPVMFPLNQ